MPRLEQSFFRRSTLEVAPELLGCYLTRRTEAGTMSGRIVEVEAYGGPDDPASHAFRGPTPRNRVMFGPAGHFYVYRSYGVHYCLNIVCEDDGVPGAVLIRALEPGRGQDLMAKNRPGRAATELSNGPGKLCGALSIDLTLNGTSVDGQALWLESGSFPGTVYTSERIGLSSGTDLPWRFFVDSSCVSRRGPVRRGRAAHT